MQCDAVVLQVLHKYHRNMSLQCLCCDAPLMQLGRSCIAAVMKLWCNYVAAVMQLWCSCDATVLQLWCSCVAAVSQLWSSCQAAERCSLRKCFARSRPMSPSDPAHFQDKETIVAQFLSKDPPRRAEYRRRRRNGDSLVNCQSGFAQDSHKRVMRDISATFIVVGEWFSHGMLEYIHNKMGEYE